jgi:hypothetical protein
MLQRERGGLVDFLLHPASAPRPSDFLRVKWRPGWTVVRPALNFTGVRTGYMGNGQTGDMGNTARPCLGHRPTP